MARPKVEDIILIRYEGEDQPRIKGGEPPTDAEGKVRKVVFERPAKPHERNAIVRAMYSNFNRKHRAASPAQVLQQKG